MSLLDKFVIPTGGGQKPPDGGGPGLILSPGRPATILEAIGVSSRNVDSFTPAVYDRHAVQDSRDLHRVLELPRRPRPTSFDAFRAEFAYLEKHGPCVCQSRFGRRCANRLNDTQAWGLHEIRECGGLLGPISVGDGKTLLDLLALMVSGCKVGVLLIPPSLRDQLLRVDWEFYGQHWELPNLGNGTWFDPKKPILHVVAYSELSSHKNSDILERIKPNIVIADEAQSVRNAGTARTKRFKRFFSTHPEAKFCCWSGTLTTRSLKDYAHLSNLALRDGSPTPLHWPTVEEWAGALDPSDFPSALGALAALCRSGEHVRDGYRRRLEETAGVVASPASQSCPAALYFSERKVQTPAAVTDALLKLYGSWTRPDGEELITGLDVFRCAKEISSGFFYKWIWPRGEPVELRVKWLAARKEWHKEMREKLKQSKEFLDSPLLLAKAAIRWHEGYHTRKHEHTTRCYNWACEESMDHVHTHDCPYRLSCTIQDEPGEFIPPHSAKGPQPTWASDTWLDWKAIRDQCRPETEGVWIDEFLARDAADWCRSGVGICWYEHDLFGRRVAELAGRPFYGPGADASAKIVGECADRGIVASIRAHGTGKNLQRFARNLFANMPSDAAVWEQALGRTHRQGQLADEVTVEVYRHTPVVIDALAKARMLAQYIEQTMGGSQKLLKATYLF
jgi:hypothetical protein